MTDAPGPPTGDDRVAVSVAARRLRNVLEPIASNVYFSPDVNDAFEALGFGPGVSADGCLTIAEPSGYYCSRAACMGQVPGEVVVAAFGVFNPALIIPAVERGWSIATADEVLEARERGATASLARIIGDQPALPHVTSVLQRGAAAGSASGRFLYAGLRSLGIPGTPWGALWRAVDTIREHRGDSHIASWIATGLDPVEIGLMTEMYYGMPSKRYHRGRGWTEADLDAGLARLRDRGLVTGEPPRLTPAGTELRESIEVATDVQQRAIIQAIGDDLDDLLDTLAPWSARDRRRWRLPDRRRPDPTDVGRTRTLTIRSRPPPGPRRTAGHLGHDPAWSIDVASRREGNLLTAEVQPATEELSGVASICQLPCHSPGSSMDARRDDRRSARRARVDGRDAAGMA